jgi:sugar phosphate permease
MNTFLSYLVKSTEYYKVPNAEAGETLGNLTFYAELAVIPSHLLLGTIMDSFGRRVPTCVGLLVTGICIACMPYGHEIYPDLCVMR